MHTAAWQQLQPQVTHAIGDIHRQEAEGASDEIAACMHVP